MNDLLLYEISELQNKYRAILVNTEKNIFKNDTTAILDEINVFWHRHKKLVHCALEYLSKPYRTFVFTAATILDIEDNEHYPFLCFGDYHIWDDPLYGYIRMATETSNKKFTLELQEQINATIKDNIAILDNLNDKVFIFPLRMLSGTKNEIINNATYHAFFSLFTVPPKTIDEYFDTFHTIDDIVSGLPTDICNMIILSDDEDASDELLQRFNNYKSNMSLPLPENASDALIFWFTLHGYLSQAFDIILTCVGFQFVPYIRFEIAFKHLLILSGNLSDIPDVDSWLFKCTVAHVLHISFDKERYSDIGVDEFVQKVKAYGFEQKVFDVLQENGISLEKPSISETVRIIDEQLAVCFSDILPKKVKG